MRDGSPHRLAHYSELLLILEGCAFFVHLVDRLAYRQAGEALRDACDEPVDAAIQLVIRMIEVSDRGEDELPASIRSDDIFEFINARGLHYATARRIVGDGPEDQTGVVALAAWTIAEAIDPDAVLFLRPIVSVALLRRMKAIEWSRLLKDIEANL